MKNIEDTEILSQLGYTKDDLTKLFIRPKEGPEGFDARLEQGKFAEKFFVYVVNNTMLFNEPCKAEWLDCVTEGLSFKERQEVIVDNAINGDCRIKFGKSDWQHIDVKKSSTVVEKSLTRFRSDGWYMFNALSLTRNNYYLVKNNDEFKKAVRETGCKIQLYNDVKWDILFNKLNKRDYPDLDFLEMDPAVYRLMVSKIRCELQDCVEPYLPLIDNLIRRVA